jgi:uncharacterized protein YcnI
MRRVLVALAAGAVGSLLVGGTAWAHVTVSPESAPKASDAVLVFQVPNEQDNASTVQVEVAFPADKPIAAASVQPVPGWTAQVTTAPVSKPIKTDEGTVSEAVSKIVWTGGSIMPGQFEQFPISVGLPDSTGPLVFKALQTYSDGTVVRWIEVPAAGGAEPDHPAPTVQLTAASDGASSTVSVPKNIATQSDVDSAKTVGIIGIVVGAIALIVAVVALFMRRRAT